MSIPDNAELVKIRLAEQRNAKSPELLLHCLLKENRIPRNGNIEKILKEAIRIEKEIDNVLDPLQEISTIIKTKELILKCEKSEKDFLDGKRCPAKNAKIQSNWKKENSTNRNTGISTNHHLFRLSRLATSPSGNYNARPGGFISRRNLRPKQRFFRRRRLHFRRIPNNP